MQYFNLAEAVKLTTKSHGHFWQLRSTNRATSASRPAEHKYIDWQGDGFSIASAGLSTDASNVPTDQADSSMPPKCPMFRTLSQRSADVPANILSKEHLRQVSRK